MLSDAFYLRKWSSYLNKGTDDDSTSDDSDSSSEAESSDEESSDPEVSQKAGDLVLPKLPYKAGDLGDVLSSDALELHEQIHKKYVDRTRELVTGTKYADMELDDVVKAIKDKKGTPIYRNANQAWNHAFYFMSISPPGDDTAPSGDLANAITQSFGSIDECREKLVKASLDVFGSGWTWLVQRGGKPGIITTANATTPWDQEGVMPLLCVDMWEHAYLLDYKADRESYADSAVKQLLNWGFADKNWEDVNAW